MPPPFAETIAAAYRTEGASLDLGRGVHEGTLHRDAEVRVPLATLNRHGLVAGATGTGKTKTLQVMTEQLSAAGVAVLVADVKGDVSGLAVPGDAEGPAAKRMADLGLPYAPAAFPVEFLSLGGVGPGVPVRASVSDFGPQLLAKVLGANETQESSLMLVFHYADSNGPAARRPRGPARAADVPDVRRGQARARGHRRAVAPDRRGAAALAARPADHRRRHVLRRAGVRGRRPPAHRRGRARRRLVPRARRGAGPPGALVDRAHVVRRRAVRDAARGRRPPAAQARRLPRRGPPAVRRRDRGVPRIGLADGAAHPLEGRGRRLRHPAPDRPARRRARAARPAHPARAARVHAGRREGPARDGRHVPAQRALRRRASCSPRSGPARPR